MQNPKPAPILRGPLEGQSLSVVGDSYRILVSGKETNGAFACIEMLIPPNGGPGPHAHPDFQESFFVIDGEVEVKSEAGSYKAKKGAYVVIPRGGIIHHFTNHTTHTAHLLCTVVPSGLEELFIEIGKPMSPGNFLPIPDMTQETIHQLQAVAEKHGQKVYPPDFLDKK